MVTLLTYGGHGQVESFWEYNSSGQNRCKLVEYETEFSVYNAEDYKRCVCSYFGEGADTCPQADPATSCSWSDLETTTTER